MVFSADRVFTDLKLMNPIYLDNNATTKPLDVVTERIAIVSQNAFANPGSRHAYGREARKVLEESRESMAAILGAKPSEIIFTSGGTESTNMVLTGISQQVSPGTIALTHGEHAATEECSLQLSQQNWKLHRLEINEAGRLREEQYLALPWNDLQLVTIILAHNETGVIQNIEPLAKLCVEHHVPLHLDAVQAVGKVPVNFYQLGAASLSISAHKFHGPRGVGALLLREDVNLKPLMFGGHQERELRPGTEPVALIAGMATALEVWHEEQSCRDQHLTMLRDRLQTGLTETCSPTVINGSQEHRLPNTLNIAFLNVNGEALLVALDIAGIACSLGSACASGSTKPAPVLVAMGCSENVTSSSVRFSVSIHNTIEQIDAAIQTISNVVQQLRSTTKVNSQ